MNPTEIAFLIDTLCAKEEIDTIQQEAGAFLLEKTSILFSRLRKVLDEVNGGCNAELSAEEVVGTIEFIFSKIGKDYAEFQVKIMDFRREVRALKIALNWALDRVEESAYCKHFHPGVFQKERQAAEEICFGRYNEEFLRVLNGSE